MIGAGITVHGQNGSIGYNRSLGGAIDAGVLNQGTISADVAGGTITIGGGNFSNEGQLTSPGGTLNLAGAVGTAGLESFDSTGGAVLLSGWLTNAGSTLLLNGASNIVTLQGASIANETITLTGGAAMIVNSGTLDGATVNGTLDVGNSVNGVSLTVTNGLTLNGTMLVGNPTNSWYGVVSFAGSQVLRGNGTVVFGNHPYANSLLVDNPGTTLVMGAGITVHGQNGSIGYNRSLGGATDAGVVNQGTISADMSGGIITIGGGSFNNGGTLIAQNGGEIQLTSGAWSNNGTVQTSGGIVNLGGSFATPDVGMIQGPGGMVNITGILNNTNATLVLDGAAAAWNLVGGLIAGGTVMTTNGASLVVNNGTFDGVTLKGALDVGNSVSGTSLTVTNGLVLNGTMVVGNPTNQWYGRVNFAGSQMLGGNGTVVFGTYGAHNSLVVANGGTTLVIGPGITMHGQSGWLGYNFNTGWGASDASVDNHGTISADVPGGTISIGGGNFSNEGLLTSPGGKLDLQVVVGPAGLGSFDSTGGAVLLSGWLTNSGSGLLLNGASNILTLQGATIAGETVTMTSGAAMIVNNGMLNGVTVNGPLDVGNSVNGATLTVTNGLLLNGTALVGSPTNGNSSWGAIIFSGTQKLGGTGTVVFGNGTCNALALADSGTTLTIGGGIMVHGQSGAIGYGGCAGGQQNVGVVNQGTISADATNGTITVDAQPLNNQGQLLSPAGVLYLAGTIAAGGLGSVQSGQGTLELGGFLTNDSQTIILPGSGNMLTLLSGATIHGGTVIATNGNSLRVSGGTLDGVVLDGTLDVGNSINGAGVVVTNNLVLNGTALVGNPTNGWTGVVGFAGVATLSGNGTVVFGNGGCNGLAFFDGGTNLTIGSGITVHGQNGGIGYVGCVGGSQNGAVVNQGTISADVTNGTITINASPFTNQGVVKSPEGFLNLGYIENTGQTLAADASTGGLNLSGGWIHGGSLVMSNNVRLVAGNLTLDGVTVNGNLDIGNQINGAVLTITNGLTLNGTAYIGNSGVGNLASGFYGRIACAGTQSLMGNGTMVLGDSSANALWLTLAGTSLTIGPGLTVRGQSGTIGGQNGLAGTSLVNQGTISADEPGGSMEIAGASFENDGVLEVKDGASLQPVAETNLNTGTIRLDHATVTFSGNFFQTNGTLDFGLASPDGNGQIILSGAASITGTLAAHFEDGFSPAPGDQFALMIYGSNAVVFTNFSMPSPELWATNATNGIFTLSVTDGYALEALVSVADETVAAGTEVTLIATVNQPGTFGFQWLHNGGAVPGATKASLVLNAVGKADSGGYAVIVTSPLNSVTSAPVQITVLSPAAILEPPAPESAHVGGDVTFSVNAAGDLPLAYQWFFNGAAITWATGPSLVLSGVGRPQAGTYSVVAGNPAGSVTSAPVALAILTGPDCPGAPTGMVAWWRGEGNAYDYAGTNDLTFIEPAFASGEVGQAFALDGSTSYLTTPASGLMPPGTNDFSIELWANFTALTPSTMAGDGSLALIARDEGLGDRNKWLFGLGGGVLYFYLNGPGLGPQFPAQAPFTPTTNQWHHLAVTRGGAVFRIYIDGAQASVETNNMAIPAANAPLTIGQAQGLFMPGLLDEISIYNRALAPAEIQAIYQAGSQGKCSTSQPLAIASAGFNSSGKFQFQVIGGQSGSTIEVQSSTDLTNWVNAWQAVLGSNPLLFIDPATTMSQQRYYRIVINP